MAAMAQRQLPKIGELIIYTDSEEGQRVLPAMVMGRATRQITKEFASIGACLNLKVFQMHEEITDLEGVPYSPYLKIAHWSFIDAVPKEVYKDKTQFGLWNDMNNAMENKIKVTWGSSIPIAKEDGDRENYPIGIQYVHTVYLDRYRSTGSVEGRFIGVYEGQLEVVNTVEGLKQRFWGFDMPYDEEVYLQPEDKVLSWIYAKNYFQSLKREAKKQEFPTKQRDPF